MSNFFPLQTISADQAASHPDLLTKLWRDEINGLLVQDVYTAEQCATIAGRLERGQHRLIRSEFPAPFKSFFLGLNLNLLPPDLGPYFAQVEPFHRALDELFAGMPSVRHRVPSVLASLDDGRPYRAAPGGTTGHMFTTLRGHLPGGFLPAHFDDEQGHRPGYRFVAPQIASPLVSFVLAFSTAEEGGATEVFDFEHGNRTYRMVDGPNEASHLASQAKASRRIKLQPGEMVLFRSGRILHGVTPVGGQRTRWTACSFMAQSRDGSVICWG